MFALLRKKSPAKKSHLRAPRRAPRRLGGECLEGRYCLSALSVGFEAMVADGMNVQLQGIVSGGPPDATYSVSLGGPVNVTLTPDGTGDFGYYGPASGLGTITATATDSAGDSGSGRSDIYDPGPSVSSLNVNAGGPGKQVFVSGSVTANSPGGLAVTFTGSAGLAASSATTDDNGNFSLMTTAGQLGEVTATVTDIWGVDSSPVTTGIMMMPPQVTSLMVNPTGQGKQVFVSGSVSASWPAGLSVTLSGPAGVGGSATTDSNGNFNLTTTASKLGEVDATVTDAWGETSPVTSTNFWVMAPQIEGFGAIQLGGGEWQFEGTVMGPDPQDDSVQLSGMTSASATPDASGHFSVIVQLGNNPTGIEYAVATDIWGQQSGQVSYSYFG